ncbi:MAG: hypothetical protein ACK5WZ_01560, partial [Pseudobdellovibrionaceae bacterium]
FTIRKDLDLDHDFWLLSINFSWSRPQTLFILFMEIFGYWNFRGPERKNPNDVSNLKRVFEKLGYTNKTYLSRNEISRLTEELTLDRQYELADKVQAMDPTRLFALMSSM